MIWSIMDSVKDQEPIEEEERLEFFMLNHCSTAKLLNITAIVPPMMPDEKLARAIRSRKRRNILQMLCNKEKMSVHEVADELDLTESSASKHLKLLYDMGLVEYEKKPPEKYYSLKIEEIKEMFEIYNKVVEKIE